MIVLSPVGNDCRLVDVPKHRGFHDRSQIRDINISHKNRILKKPIEWSMPVMTDSSPV
jgi:hypothetical protein